MQTTYTRSESEGRVSGGATFVQNARVLSSQALDGQVIQVPFNKVTVGQMFYVDIHGETDRWQFLIKTSDTHAQPIADKKTAPVKFKSNAAVRALVSVDVIVHPVLTEHLVIPVKKVDVLLGSQLDQLQAGGLKWGKMTKALAVTAIKQLLGVSQSRAELLQKELMKAQPKKEPEAKKQAKKALPKKENTDARSADAQGEQF